MAYGLTIICSGDRGYVRIETDSERDALQQAHDFLVGSEQFGTPGEFTLADCGIDNSDDLQEYWRLAGYDSVILRPEV